MASPATTTFNFWDQKLAELLNNLATKHFDAPKNGDKTGINYLLTFSLFKKFFRRIYSFIITFCIIII